MRLVCKEGLSFQRPVTIEFEGLAVKLGRAALDFHLNVRGRAESQVLLGVAGQHLEFLDGILVRNYFNATPATAVVVLLAVHGKDVVRLSFAVEIDSCIGGNAHGRIKGADQRLPGGARN